jgi:hypothetical protein
MMLSVDNHQPSSVEVIESDLVALPLVAFPITERVFPTNETAAVRLCSIHLSLSCKEPVKAERAELIRF